MLWGLITAAFLMGLVGGPHCLAMCGSVCSGIRTSGQRQLHAFQFGRVLSYASLGAVAGALVQTMVWANEYLKVFQPVLTTLLACVLAWGLILLIYGRQPLWARGLSSWVSRRINQAGRTPRHSFVLGMVWMGMPCGLLYSALMLAVLSGGAWQGGLVMLAFVSATLLWLNVFAKFFERLRAWRQAWGQRLAGLLLIFASAWSLWMHINQLGPFIC